MSDVQLANEHDRLAEIIDVVVAIASNNFDRRATVGDGTELLDRLATGLNMLAEEVGQRVAREQEFHKHLVHNERLIAVGQLAAGVAHEINNPAAFLLTNLTLLRSTLDELERTTTADIATSSAPVRALLRQSLELTLDDVAGMDGTLSIVGELRNFARLEPEQLETLSLTEVIDDACKLVRAEVSYRARLQVEPMPPLPLRGDRTKLTQVFTNLLLNAAQSIPEGAATTNTVLVTTAREHDWARVTVRDTGSGISADAQARLFEPFYTTKPRAGGTGLGLAISADIVRHHGGVLRLDETSGAGTTFEALLPLVAGKPVPSQSITSPTVSRVAKARVLLIDDEVMLLRAYSRWLSSMYRVEVAAGGRQAMARIAADPEWDVVLCDVMMPDVDGVAVHEWIVAHAPTLAERMIFCTGGAFTPRSIAFTERMTDRLLRKPIRLSELEAAIAKIRAPKS